MDRALFPHITTERLVLALAGPEYATRMFEYQSRNRAHLEPWEPPRERDFYTESYWARRAARNVREFEAGASVRLAMVARDDVHGPLLGMCNFNQVFRGPFLNAVLGYSMDRGAQGNGYMHEALTAAIAYMFRVVGLHRISANYVPTNARSAAVLRRLGFAIEGYARGYLFIHDGWKDHVLTSLTNPNPVAPQP